MEGAAAAGIGDTNNPTQTTEAMEASAEAAAADAAAPLLERAEDEQPDEGVPPEEEELNTSGNDDNAPQERLAFLNNDKYRRILNLLLSPLTDEQGHPTSIVMGLLSIVVCGTLLGLILPKEYSKFGDSQHWYAVVSSCLGYTYFVAWSVSFYPQVLVNVRRRTTAGLSVEFASLNVLGFACYTAYNVALYCSPAVQQLYRDRHGDDSQIPVQSNDVAFAVHAFVLSSITLAQILYYDGLRGHEMSPAILALIVTILCIGILGALMTAFVEKGETVNWLNYIYLLSFCKIAVTLVKYMPQVYLNWKRQSTVGWSIWQILLDLTGGLLSNLQLVLDCAALHDFSGITGNLPKLVLGQASMLFDVIFCVQHYVLYPSSSSDHHDEDDEMAPMQQPEQDENAPEVLSTLT